MHSEFPDDATEPFSETSMSNYLNLSNITSQELVNTSQTPSGIMFPSTNFDDNFVNDDSILTAQNASETVNVASSTITTANQNTNQNTMEPANYVSGLCLCIHGFGDS